MSQLRIADAPLRRDLAAPALRAFFNIADRWGLGNEQERVLLGSPGRSTFYRWKRDLSGQLPHDVLERISYILGIYKALHLIFGNEQQADAWISRANDAPLFGGRSALDRMLGGQVADLFVVRQYLDAQRGWG
ncbi:MbcA/ParS/Xre antitoxin family protein [Luteimonas arsenica]|uniref:MbcA/ParS/Xre antitoxin family protein n=1 Tax=Luteimonas arsenica TaxID=1586242 RepID=UPI001056B9C5|nr:MbcA/ParS/Xre antitoxin family protein [Luteimonas arsenica]